MNFIIYNETTGRIDQTGYTLWEAPNPSLEYIAAEKVLLTTRKLLQEGETKLEALLETIQVSVEGVATPSDEIEILFYEQKIETLSEKLPIDEAALATLEQTELERYNEAKAAFLASLQGEGQLALEGEADASTQKIQVSDKTIISREPDPTPFSNINRSRRDSLLNLSDWTQTADSPLSDSAKQEWQVYRAALRSLPETVDTFNTAYLEPSDLPQIP